MGYGRSETGQSDWTWISTISSIFFIGLSRRAACGGAAQRGSPETQQFPHGLFVPACYTLMATYFFQLIEEVCRFSAREELLPLSKLPQAGRVHPHQRVRMTRVNTFWQDPPPSPSHPFLDPNHLRSDFENSLPVLILVHPLLHAAKIWKHDPKETAWLPSADQREVRQTRFCTPLLLSLSFALSSLLWCLLFIPRRMSFPSLFTQIPFLHLRGLSEPFPTWLLEGNPFPGGL